MLEISIMSWTIFLLVLIIILTIIIRWLGVDLILLFWRMGLDVMSL